MYKDMSIEIKKPRSICMNAVVCAIKDTTPHLRQFSLQHDLLKEIGPLAPGAHFKIFIPSAKGETAVLPDVSGGRASWPDEKTKPYIRTYTVRSLDRVTGILDVEFVLHGDSGPASAWAEMASVGDTLGMGIKTSGDIRDPSDWHLFAGDETAIPAISAILENLPAKTTGIALLEVDKEDDKFHISTKSGIEIRWLIRNGMPPEQSDLLLDAVKNVLLPDPALMSRFVWIAGEDKMVRNMRSYLTDQLQLSRQEFRATVYWTAGLSEED